MTDYFVNSISSDKCFQITERFLTDYSFSAAKEDSFELHFIENGSGLRRVVGDSEEYTENYELILTRGSTMEHSWQIGNCQSKMIREVVIWFSNDFFNQSLLRMDEFQTIKKMLSMASQGICFPLSAIMRVYSQLDEIPSEEGGFGQYIKIIKLIHDLSECEGMRTLANSPISSLNYGAEDPRISKVKGYIREHYLEQVTLTLLSKMAGMTSVSFSRFFKQQTGKNVSDYIIDVRLSNAAQMLLESSKSISDICFESGFNNLSNFNRIFKKKKGITPKMLRSHYRKDKYTF